MASPLDSSGPSIRSEAERFLETHGFLTPPLPSDQALAARKLVVAPLSLDDLLIKANLPPEESGKIQAMLDANERTVAFKSGLPTRKRQMGSTSRSGARVHPLAERSPLLLSVALASRSRAAAIRSRGR